MTRPTVVTGVALVVVIGLAVAFWVVTREQAPPSTEPLKESSSGMPAMKQSIERPMPVPKGHDEQDMPGADANLMTIAPERLQSIGVKFQEAVRRPLDKLIRTVGRVEIDERLVGRVNLKFEGWIEELHVSAIGDHVKKDQVLFTIYSPDLVATQEEYLLALQSYRELGQSEFPEVARGAKELLEAPRRRLQ